MMKKMRIILKIFYTKHVMNGKIVRTALTKEVSNSLNQSWNSTQKLLDPPINK